VLFDSRVICEYLDAHGAGPALYPQGEARWPVLRLAALGEGLLEAGIALANDSRKDPAHWSEWYADRLHTKLRRTLDCLETEAASLEGPVDIARLTVGCALGYLDFRGFIGDWRPTRPNLANWYANFAKRPSMQATEPKG
jgi:glutathione S-transferase